MVLVHDKSSECALHMYEVSLKYLYRFQVVERTRFCDGQTGGRKGKPEPSRGET